MNAHFRRIIAYTHVPILMEGLIVAVILVMIYRRMDLAVDQVN